MNQRNQSLIMVCFLLMTITAMAQLPDLPPGAQTKWVVDDPEEIVTYLLFDPATVRERIPPFLRAITIQELAEGNVSWAGEHLQRFPAHAAWGISFIEIVRAKTFTIDGRSPRWPADGAAALWFARVAPADPAVDPGPGKPFLALEFWLPDRSYVAYMRARRHYASYGDVRLRRDANGAWRGSIKADGLDGVAVCSPAGRVDGSGSAGMQAIYPPADSGLTGPVRIVFAGHRIQSCSEGASWKFAGAHALARGMVVGPTSFQFGYDLVGGAYRR